MARQVRLVVRDLNLFVDRSMVRLARRAHANLVAPPSEGGTPVDTGFARSNWIAEVGSPPEAPEGSKESVQATGIQVGLTNYTNLRGPIFISNPTLYINRLNEGWSDQAPAGFVQVAVRRAINEVQMLGGVK